MACNEYICRVCDTVYKNRLAAPMCCEQSTELCVLSWNTIHTQSSYLDNHFYDNSQDVFDEGLGVRYRTRRQRQEIMDAMGVTDGADIEEMGPIPKKSPVEKDMLDALEEARIRVRDNNLPPETPIPDTHKDPGMDAGYDTQEF